MARALFAACALALLLGVARAESNVTTGVPCGDSAPAPAPGSANDTCPADSGPVPQPGGDFNCTAFNITCPFPKITTVFGIGLCQAPMAPSWVLAVLVGLIGGWKIWKLGPDVVGSRSYAVSFFTYAVMMTTGFVVHCLFFVECGITPSTKRGEVTFGIFALADMTLTSSIAMSFLFNGFVDLGKLSEKSPGTWLLMLTTYLLILVGYLKGVGFMIMYMGLVALGCGSYLLLELLHMWRQRAAPGLRFFVLAGLVGGGSFLLLSDTKAMCGLCAKVGGWVMEGMWYYAADISMAFLAKYVLSSRVATEALPPSSVEMGSVRYEPLRFQP